MGNTRTDRFDMSSATAKDSLKGLITEDQVSERREKSRQALHTGAIEAILAIRNKITRFKSFQIFLLRIDSKALERIGSLGDGSKVESDPHSLQGKGEKSVEVQNDFLLNHRWCSGYHHGPPSFVPRFDSPSSYMYYTYYFHG